MTQLNTYMQAQAKAWPAHLSKLTHLRMATYALAEREKELLVEVARLETLDPADAKPHWRTKADPRYLYLVHPQKNGMRKREYIGADPDKQATAMSRVEAHRQLVARRQELAAIDTRLDLITRLLARCLRVAIDGTTW